MFRFGVQVRDLTECGANGRVQNRSPELPPLYQEEMR